MTSKAYIESIEPDEHAGKDLGTDESFLSRQAQQCARSMVWAPGKISQNYSSRLKSLNEAMQQVFAVAQNPASALSGAGSGSPTGQGSACWGQDAEQQRWLQENAEFLRSQMAMLQGASEGLSRTEHVRLPDGEVAPRALLVAEDMLAALEYQFEEPAAAEYLRAFQGAVVLRLRELWEMAPSLKLVLLERIAAVVLGTARAGPAGGAVSTCVRSLREIDQTQWHEFVESMVAFDEILRCDPAGAYARMDAESRDRYRQEVARLADCSEYSELEIAQMAVSLARQSLRTLPPGPAQRDSRACIRRSHVGYYLIAEGRDQLYRRANLRLPFRDRVQLFLRRHPNEFYIPGIEILTLVFILAILWPANFSSPWGALLAALVLLIPCSQSAVEIMNHLTTSLLDPQRLPRLDFANSIPDDCATMVVVPTLLLNEKQVRQLVNDLEVRYVGNMSPNLHFALLTDLPDSAEQPREDDPLVEMCGGLIRSLNSKYAGKGAGTFAMFHRHRVYNRREGVWMGWERKRGKLLDFNKLVLGQYDSFPYKVGDLSLLPRIRYVLTLDSDTELPRGTAQRLIGTLAHPLCQAVIDREKNIVKEGYGILQPRIGVSVQSTTQSRLASIYSGWTGFDIYTQAVSDVYQDLHGEGTFVGKGLYEVRTVHQVLSQRFPRNSILSHDLIEGAYTRAGLVTDVKLIDLYPSHYSAYVRRKHRWVRGDWQIVEWLFSRVPDEHGRRVANPISLISRWKILDNLRRSLVDPATVVWLLLSWTILPGRPLYWTGGLIAVLLAPILVEFVSGFLRAAMNRSVASMKQSARSLEAGCASVLLAFAFLLHDALVCMDAIWRSMYRRVISRQRLLQWETAAQAEHGATKLTPVDLYLLATPAIAFVFGAVILAARRSALWVALPMLALWGCSKLLALWLDRPPRAVDKTALPKDELFTRRMALRTWRYFAEFSNAEHNWLIPDNVQQTPPQIAARVSPTDLGLLLNARQAACELGYVTVPEFVELTARTLETMDRMQVCRGHLLNWYDTRTAAPLEPWFVSTVDSGNLAASLVTLNQGCRTLLTKPLLSPALLEGYDDHLRVLAGMKGLSSWRTIRRIRARKEMPLLQRACAVIADPVITLPAAAEARWFAEQVRTRQERLHRLIAEYMPWVLPEFQSVSERFNFAEREAVQPLSQLPGFLAELQSKLEFALASGDGTENDRRQFRRLMDLVAGAHGRCAILVDELNQIAGEAEHWFNRMDFSFLLDRRRKLLSIGYLVDTGQLHPACYDLLASESRVATFLAIAKGDIPQDVWFRLGRTHVPTRAGPALVSWAGTLFEYLMPAIWMESYRDTLLRNSMERATRAQQAYAAINDIPWGISESAYSELNDGGAYRYRFFGVPELSMQAGQCHRLVVAPYASALALSVDPVAAVRNLRQMVKRGWHGAYGFYEAGDLGPVESPSKKCRLVETWMAHHQGMILLSVANFVCGEVVQKWFHRDVYVQATQLLLQERMVLRDVTRAWRIRPPVAPARTYAVEGGQLALQN